VGVQLSNKTYRRKYYSDKNDNSISCYEIRCMVNHVVDAISKTTTLFEKCLFSNLINLQQKRLMKLNTDSQLLFYQILILLLSNCFVKLKTS
jgi:hypothetical protein